MTKDARPLIGVTADLSEASNKFDQPQEATFFIPQRYVSAIERAGALALILPPNPSAAAVGRMIASLDGLVITGGNFDIDPRCYGEKPMRELREVKARRTEFELEVTEQVLKKDLPITITSSSYPGEKFSGKIAVVDPFINDATRTGRVRIDVANADLKLRPDMYVDVDLTMDMGEGIETTPVAEKSFGIRSTHSRTPRWEQC